MSAKGKLNVPAAPVETLVTVERLAGIQRAMGSTLVYTASLPGRQYTGNNSLRIPLRTCRTPYVWVRFRAETIAEPPNHAKSSFAFYEHEGFGTVLPETAKSYVFPYSTSADFVLIHHCSLSQGRDINAKLVDLDLTGGIDREYFADPLNLYLVLTMDTQNGSNFNSYIQDVVIGGCTTPDPPFLVKQGGVAVETIIRSGPA